MPRRLSVGDWCRGNTILRADPAIPVHCRHSAAPRCQVSDTMRQRSFPAQRSRQSWPEPAAADEWLSQSASSRGAQPKRNRWISLALRALLVPILSSLLGFIGGVAYMRNATEQRALVDDGGEPPPGPLAAWPSPSEVDAESSSKGSSEEAAALSDPAGSEVLDGIKKTLKEQFAAFNAEDMDRLKGTFSAEAVFHPRDLIVIEQLFSVNDLYYRLDNVEILTDSDSPDAEFEAPYTTIAVTHTKLALPPGDPRNKVFRRRAAEDDSDLEALADKLGYKNRDVVTTRVELLFVREGREWKFVSAISLAAIVSARGRQEAGGAPVPFPILRRPSKSVFQ